MCLSCLCFISRRSLSTRQQSHPRKGKAFSMNNTLHKKWSFLLRISSVNVTKSARDCKNPEWKEILDGKLHFLCSDNTIYYNKMLICCIQTYMNILWIYIWICLWYIQMNWKETTSQLNTVPRDVITTFFE